MTDTVAILNTIRATFADSEPKRFGIKNWFNYRTKCGCVIGLSLTTQPLLASQLGLSLHSHYAIGPAAYLQHGDRVVTFNEQPRPDSVRAAPMFANLIGITDEEAIYLFDGHAYKRGTKRGPTGHAEALRRLDEVIARYSAKATEPVRETAAA